MKMALFPYIIAALLLCEFIHGESSTRRILVFGGNGFMGASLVQKLLEKGDNLTLINRGNWYWDSGKVIRPFVTHIRCDRHFSLQSCHELQRFLWKSDHYFDAVVDFSAYHAHAVSEALAMLKGRIGRYIYISSDSVYEVCLKNHSEPTLESDAIRPYSLEEQRAYNARDDYGHRKLECEEVLVQQRQGIGGVPYVLLRLPDVIGPRDNTNRWWMYQLWLRLSGYLESPVSIPRTLMNRPLSFVYSEDVSKTILYLIQCDIEKYDQAYNLATKESPTLLSLLETMKKYLNVSGVNIVVSEDPDAFHLFPSVRLGPVATFKAEREINWQPTPFEEIVSRNVEFYEEAIKNVEFDTARKNIIRSMQAYFTKHPYSVIYGLKGMYGISYPESRDEL